MEMPREWSPLPPEKIIKESVSISKTQHMFRSVILFLLIFPVWTIFWPFWLFRVRDYYMSPNRTMAQKVRIIVLAVFMSGIYLLLMGVIGIAIQNPGSLKFLMICLCIILLLPWIFEVILIFTNRTNK